ncbi:Oxidoreductase [Elsinoe australis]|uniref:Oxidoreductase n=1 Tax=Elsinoe australis TaxID=40998 RepID=A0A2P7Z669_9PEZI|nr:Oxidoreductase [Elsinoe australis]
MLSTAEISLSARDAQKLAFARDGITEASARKAAELLTENHRKYHIYFNDKGFHNHILHHLVTLLGLGASPEEIQLAYDNNASYQREPYPVHDRIRKDFSNPETFTSCLSNEEHYADFLDFFTAEIQNKGIPDVVNEYLFSRSPIAEDMLARLFAGVIHPLLHLGFALETTSAPLVAEALAETAVHSNFLHPTFTSIEASAAHSTSPPKTLLQLIHEARADPTFLAAAKSESSPNLIDGITNHAPDATTSLLSQYRVPSPTLPTLAAVLAEQQSTLAHMVLSAQHPSLTKRPKLDFFLIHSLNAGLFFPVLFALPWLSDDNKCRLLEFKARHDVLLYVGMYCPSLHPEYVKSYTPLPEHESWEGIFKSANRWEDDGHCAKVIRALAAGERLCGPLEGEEWCVTKKEEWKLMAAVAVESVGGEEGDWARFCGDEGAWEKVLSMEEFERVGRKVGRRGNAEAAVERIEERERKEQEGRRDSKGEAKL